MLNLGLLYICTRHYCQASRSTVSFVNYCPMRFIIIITSAKIEASKKKNYKICRHGHPAILPVFALMYHGNDVSQTDAAFLHCFIGLSGFPFILTVFLPFFHSSSLLSLYLPPPPLSLSLSICL